MHACSAFIFKLQSKLAAIFGELTKNMCHTAFNTEYPSAATEINGLSNMTEINMVKEYFMYFLVNPRTNTYFCCIIPIHGILG